MSKLIVPYLPSQYKEFLNEMKSTVNPGIDFSGKPGTFSVKRVSQGKLVILPVDSPNPNYNCIKLVMSTVEELPNQTEKDLLYPKTMTLQEVIAHLQKEIKPLENLDTNKGKDDTTYLPPEGVEWLFLFC